MSSLHKRLVLLDSPLPPIAVIISIGETPMEWLQTSQSYIFKATLPGFKNEDIHVHVFEGNVLQIVAEHTDEDGEEKYGVKLYNLERHRDSFFRQYQLPHDAHGDKARAYNEEGILTVVVPKKRIYGNIAVISKL